MAERNTYNDGIVKICTVTNTADAGKKPVEGLTVRTTLRYHRRTVGVNRLYAAMQAQAKIDMLIRCHYRPDVSTQDVAITQDGKQFKISAVQYIEGATPPAMDLTLERVTHDYAVL